MPRSLEADEGDGLHLSKPLSRFSEYCESILEPFQLCGHSLGGVLALNYAMDYPEKVQDLVLIAAPYRMPKMALRLQNTVFRLMPGRAFQGIGLSKQRVLQLTRSMVTLDLTSPALR